MPALAQVPHINVTDGQVKQLSDGFNIESPSSRFEIEGSDGESLSITVKYNGTTNAQSTLASGATVSQVALKLRSLNQCNLVYVARRFSPKSEIVIMTKINPGKSTHQQCGDGGYQRIGSGAVPAVRMNDSFSLSGVFVNNRLEVSYQGKPVWQGNIPFDQKGSSGVRTDNAKVSITIN